MCTICSETLNSPNLDVLEDALGVDKKQLIITLGGQPDLVLHELMTIYTMVYNELGSNEAVKEFFIKSRKAGDNVSSLRKSLLTGDLKILQRIKKYVQYIFLDAASKVG